MNKTIENGLNSPNRNKEIISEHKKNSPL